MPKLSSAAAPAQRTSLPGERARAIAARQRAPVRQVINEALRAGLERVETTAASKPYRTMPRNLGLLPGRNLDNIQELLAQVEGEDSR